MKSCCSCRTIFRDWTSLSTNAFDRGSLDGGCAWRERDTRRKCSLCTCSVVCSNLLESLRWDASCSCSFQANPDATYLAETVPIYALQADVDRDPHFTRLKMVETFASSVVQEDCILSRHDVVHVQSLLLDPPPSIELRAPARTKSKSRAPCPRRRKKWVGNGDIALPASENDDGRSVATEQQTSLDDTAKTSSNVTEFVRYRSPITNTGCGVIAVSSPNSPFRSCADVLSLSRMVVRLLLFPQDILLQTSSVLRRVCLNYCQVTDAGAILLASALRVGFSSERIS